MSETSPTRMNLLARRNQLKLAAKGVDLLKKKRDALVSEFFALVHQGVMARKNLNRVAEEAYADLFLAKAFDGPGEMEALAVGVPRLSNVQAEVENVWGTKVPHLRAEWPEGCSLSPIASGGQSLAAQQSFRALTKALLAVANTEARLRRIGEEIKKTTRRVNALEQVVIPGVHGQIRFIQQVLEQREREDIFRLKRIKGKLESREAGRRAG